MSTTPRTDAEQKRQEDWAEEVHADTYDCWMETFKFARQLELENIKLLEVARAAKFINEEFSSHKNLYDRVQQLLTALKSLEESGVKIC